MSVPAVKFEEPGHPVLRVVPSQNMPGRDVRTANSAVAGGHTGAARLRVVGGVAAAPSRHDAAYGKVRPVVADRAHSPRKASLKRAAEQRSVLDSHELTGTLLAGLRALVLVGAALVLATIGLIVGSAFASSTDTLTVNSGDTLSSIAASIPGVPSQATGVADIKELNGLSTDAIRPGQQLRVPRY